MANLSMTMPDLSTISSTVKVVRWLVEVGQPVRRGDHLLEVETDKSVMVVESTVTGTLKATLAGAGQEVPAGLAIAMFEVAGSAAPEKPKTPPDLAPGAGPAPSGTPLSRPPAVPGGAGGSFFARNRQAAKQGPVGDSPGGGDEE